MISALYLYLLVFALAQMRNHPGTAYELLALLSLIAFSLIRLESSLFAIGVLLVSPWQSSSYVSRLKLVVPFVVLLVAWYVRVYFILPESPDRLALLTPELVIGMIGALLGFGLFVVAADLQLLDPIVRRMPFLTVIALGLLSIILTLVKPS